MSQSYTDFEHIVVDGNSEDGTREHCNTNDVQLNEKCIGYINVYRMLIVENLRVRKSIDDT